MLDSLFRIRMGGSLSTLAGCLVAAGLLSACAVGPDYHAPKAPEVTAFTRQADPAVAAGTADIRPDWWTAYGSPRLDGLVQRALQHNPGIDAGLANLRQAQELVTAQRGLFFPQVQAGYSANRQNSGQVLASPLASNASLFTLNTAQLSVGFVPDVFGGNQRQVESLQAGADSQRLQLEALRVTLASNVATAVIQEQMLVEQIAVLEEALQLAQQQLAHTRGLQAQGYVSGLDLAQQESAYAQTADVALCLQPSGVRKLLLCQLQGFFKHSDLLDQHLLLNHGGCHIAGQGDTQRLQLQALAVSSRLQGLDLALVAAKHVRDKAHAELCRVECEEAGIGGQGRCQHLARVLPVGAVTRLHLWEEQATLRRDQLLRLAQIGQAGIDARVVLEGTLHQAVQPWRAVGCPPIGSDVSGACGNRRISLAREGRHLRRLGRVVVGADGAGRQQAGGDQAARQGAERAAHANAEQRIKHGRPPRGSAHRHPGLCGVS